MAHVKFEIPADDLARAIEFYREVFGWNAKEIPLPAAVVDTHGRKVDPLRSDGVISPRNEFVNAPVLLITVDSIDETARKVRQAGGKLLTDREAVGTFGFSMYVEDSEGSVLCLWEEVKPA